MKIQQLQFKNDQQEKELLDLRYSKSDFKNYNDTLVDKCEQLMIQILNQSQDIQS
jgi:hypothetical protein